MPAAALFIDNSNFYHSLKTSRRLPFTPMDYGKLFGEIEKLGLKLKLVCLYDAMKDIELEPQQYALQQRFHQGIRDLAVRWPIKIRTRKLKYRHIDKSKEILPVEKGIDILLVIDAIKAALSKEAEKVIILSGDADFVPAVRFIEDELKTGTINLHLYQGSSTELRNACKERMLIDFENSEIVIKTGR